MLSKITSCGIIGIEGFIVAVETDISNGLPAFDIVGLGGIAVKEAKERVRAALKNSGFEFPLGRITVNLAPASLKKEGSTYDLPIALGILAATGQFPLREYKDSMFVGELSLDGQIKRINGALNAAACACESGIKNLFLPIQNADEAAVINEVNVLPAESIKEIFDHLTNRKAIDVHQVDVDTLFGDSHSEYEDFSDVKGQANVKRALEIAASGGHNCLMIGSPGCGKTMLAKRLPGILPDITFEESLEVTKIHSIAGILPEGASLVTKRPFRSPHHTISNVSLTGGGKIPKPGEISLAHYGVLFLDEFPEFSKSALEVMRQPLEDGNVTISRINASLTYPSVFLLLAAMNPCKCGYLLDESRGCICSQHEIDNYMGKISGPLLDRIDIQIEVPNIKYEDLQSIKVEEASAEIKKRVNEARKIQLERYKNFKIFSNAQLPPSLIIEFCQLDSKGKKILESAFKKLSLSARAYNRILKVSRTIADMEKSKNINERHIAEAIQYRSLDRKFQGSRVKYGGSL